MRHRALLGLDVLKIRQTLQIVPDCLCLVAFWRLSRLADPCLPEDVLSLCQRFHSKTGA